MPQETISNIPNIIIRNSIDILHPDNLLTIFDLISPSLEDLLQIGEILDFLNKKQVNPHTREAILNNSLDLFDHDISDLHIENNLPISEKLFPIIMQNQIDRSLQPIWQDMIDKKSTPTNSTDSLDMKLLEEGNPTYGLYGIALLPDKDMDYSKPPLDVLPSAFSGWVHHIDSGEAPISNQIPLFFRELKAQYSDSAVSGLIELLEVKPLPEWAQKNIVAYYKKMTIEQLVGLLEVESLPKSDQKDIIESYEKMRVEQFVELLEVEFLPKWVQKNIEAYYEKSQQN